MLKKTISSILMTALLLSSIIGLNAQEKSYVMWESIMITPDNTKLKVFGENMRKHNQKYHKDGPYKAYVFNIATGPNLGKLIWEMGPLTYSHLDGRPSENGHDEDWRDNIMPYIKKTNTREYWKKDLKLSNTDMLDPENFTHPLLYVRYHEVVKNEGHNVKHLFTQISKAVKAMEGENPWGIYYNEFRQGYKIGRHIATVGFFKNWAELDEDENFKETFIKVNGKGSWEPFIENMNDTFSNSWDEIWKFNPKLSGR